MKKLKLIGITGMLIFVLLVNRFAVPTKASGNEVNIFKQIEQQMPYPDFAKKDNLRGKVLVEFKFDEKGNVQLLNINYSNSILKNYVAERLKQMHFGSNDMETEKIYRIAISFKLIS